MKKTVKILLCCILLFVLCLPLVGCNNRRKNETPNESTDEQVDPYVIPHTVAFFDYVQFGEKTSFYFYNLDKETKDNDEQTFFVELIR